MHLLELYNHERFSPDVDRAFERPARERARAAPLRTFVVLPARRLVALWSAVPAGARAAVDPQLRDPPRRRYLFGVVEHGCLPARGSGRSRRSCGSAAGRRAGCCWCACAIDFRSAFHSFAEPHATMQCYVVEVLPLVIVLGVCGLGALAASPGALVQRLSGGGVTAPPRAS